MSELSKLKWQCRRGTLELDILLTRYLETCFDCANKDEQAEFISLLKLEDTVLIPYLMGDREPELASTVSLVKKISGLSPPK
jgi:antitoxin CptB